MGGWVGCIACLDVLEERKISRPSREPKYYLADIFRVVVTVPDVSSSSSFYRAPGS
jgi:hypothetical protein